jgi:NADH:ubiquinone oxidoreductase subunit F (NADH-binding)
MAQICTRGPEWFRLVGPPEEPGTALFTISGAVVRPSVVEAPVGTPITEILAGAGGPTAPLQALLVGGFFGTWVPAGAGLVAPYSRAGLQPLGASPGAGCIIALAADACGLIETARMLAWFAAESAGQCGPCLYGLADLAAGAATVASGAGQPAHLAQIRRWAGQIDGRGGCHHPDGAVRLLRSALSVFGADLDHHLAGRPCPGAGARPAVYVPRPGTTWR